MTGVPAWLSIVSWTLISLALLSAVLILGDIFLRGYRQHMKIMDVVWPVTALYFGPIAIVAYVKWGRPSSHRWMQSHSGHMPEKPFWAKVGVGATHCGAGCTLGDLIAEWLVLVLDSNS